MTHTAIKACMPVRLGHMGAVGTYGLEAAVGFATHCFRRSTGVVVSTAVTEHATGPPCIGAAGMAGIT